MGRDVKEKESRKDIKLLNKAEIVSGHLKDSVVKTRMDVSEAQDEDRTCPSTYAGEKFSAGTKKVADFTGKQIWAQSEKTVQRVSKIRRGFSSRKHEAHYSTNEQTFGAENGTPDRQDDMLTGRDMQSQIKNFEIKQKDKIEKEIKTLRRSQQEVKQFSYSAGKDIKQVVYPVQKPYQQERKIAQTSARASGQNVLRAAKDMDKTVKNSRKMGSSISVTKRLIRGVPKIAKRMASTTRSIFLLVSTFGSAAVVLILMVVLFGSVLSVSGGNNGNADDLISVEVRQYESTIWRYASQYGIEDYTELIKAVMMQESGGRGQDPMQSSECGYNNRYPRTPNGIIDPAYSIECGVQMLRDSIQMADVKNPIDITRIKLALQGYNFGNAYINWAVEKDGKYTAANAAQYSDMMAQRMGWRSYGDKEYTSHVLRYYAFREVVQGGGSKAIVEVALSQVGNIGGEPYWRWYGFSGREEWCACFVSWCAEQCGYIESGLVPKFAYCPNGAAWFQEHGRWKGRDYVPISGDIIFFDFDGDRISEHVGIVEKVEDGMIYTVEGNYEDECSKASYLLSDIGIAGIGVCTY